MPHKRLTETEWLNSRDPEVMIKSLTGRGCRLLDTEKRSKIQQFSRSCLGFYSTFLKKSFDLSSFTIAKGDYEVALETVRYVLVKVAQSVTEKKDSDILLAIIKAKENQAIILRDIFGNHYQKQPRIKKSWLTWEHQTALSLAQQIYQEQAFSHLPVLADALEDAGCQETSILDHLRFPGPHVRGCWALDLILGKK